MVSTKSLTVLYERIKGSSKGFSNSVTSVLTWHPSPRKLCPQHIAFRPTLGTSDHKANSKSCSIPHSMEKILKCQCLKKITQETPYPHALCHLGSLLCHRLWAKGHKEATFSVSHDLVQIYWETKESSLWSCYLPEHTILYLLTEPHFVTIYRTG